MHLLKMMMMPRFTGSAFPLRVTPRLNQSQRTHWHWHWHSQEHCIDVNNPRKDQYLQRKRANDNVNCRQSISLTFRTHSNAIMRGLALTPDNTACTPTLPTSSLRSTNRLNSPTSAFPPSTAFGLRRSLNASGPITKRL